MGAPPPPNFYAIVAVYAFILLLNSIATEFLMFDLNNEAVMKNADLQELVKRKHGINRKNSRNE